MTSTIYSCTTAVTSATFCTITFNAFSLTITLRCTASIKLITLTVAYTPLSTIAIITHFKSTALNDEVTLLYKMGLVENISVSLIRMSDKLTNRRTVLEIINC